MLSVLLANVLNSKFVENKRECDVFAGAFLERGSACHWEEAKCSKVEFESIIDNFPDCFRPSMTFRIYMYTHPSMASA